MRVLLRLFGSVGLKVSGSHDGFMAIAILDPISPGGVAWGMLFMDMRPLQCMRYAGDEALIWSSIYMAISPAFGSSFEFLLLQSLAFFPPPTPVF